MRHPWAKALVSAALFALLFLVLPWAEVRAALGRLSGPVWLVAVLGFLAGHLAGTFKWRLIVNASRAALRVPDAIRCYAAGLFANLCLPSIVGGDVLRMALAGRATRRPEAALWGGVLDRLTDTAALALLVAGGGLFVRQALPGWGGEALAALVLVGAVLGALALPFAARQPLTRWPRKLRRPVGRSLAALRRLARNPAAAAGAFAMSLTVQAGFVLLNAWIGAQVGVHVPLAVWFLVWPLAKIAALIPISLGGLAVREASLAALLLPFGVPAATGVVASLLWQTVLIAGGLVSGLVWLVLARLSHTSGPGSVLHDPARAAA